jgi:hypothetical protein
VVIGVTSSLKGGNEVVSPSVQRLGHKHCGFASERDDFTANPFKVLAALLSIRKDVHGVPRRYRANLLEAPPRLHPGLGRPCRKLVSEKKPTLVAHVTNITSHLYTSTEAVTRLAREHRVRNGLELSTGDAWLLFAMLSIASARITRLP